MEAVLFFGGLGGVGRGLVGYTKYALSYKNVEFDWKYFSMTVGVSAAVGLAVVWAIDGAGISFAGGAININPALAFIIGYAGGDAIENLYKIILQKPVLGSIDKLKK